MSNKNKHSLKKLVWSLRETLFQNPAAKKKPKRQAIMTT